MSQLSLLLKQYQGEGTLDSSGRFTIDLQVARQKLGRFQLAESGMYILLLVQCGVALKCRSIEVRVGSRKASVLWREPQPQRFSCARFLAYLHNPLEAVGSGHGDQAARHLALAVHAVGQGGTVELVLLDDDLLPLRIRVGQKLELERVEERLVDWRFELVRSGQGGLMDWLRRLMPIVLSEHKLVNSRCQHCPVPLSIDGMRVEPGPWRGRQAVRSPAGVTPMGLDFTLVALHLVTDRGGATQCLREPSPPTACFQGARQGGMLEESKRGILSDTLVDSYYLLRPGEIERFLAPGSTKSKQRQCVGLVIVRLGFAGAALLTVVHDGVALDAREVDVGCPGARIVVYAPKLQCDLSQLAVVENAEFRRLVGVLRKLIRSRMEECLPQLKLLNRYRQRVADNLPYLAAALSGSKRNAPVLKEPPQTLRSLPASDVVALSGDDPYPQAAQAPPGRRPFRRR